MSDNPLNEFDNVTVKHILVGFQYTQDACTFDITREVGFAGNSFSTGCGKGITFVNEFEDPSFSINNAESTWNFFSPSSKFTSSYIGNIEIVDRAGALFAEKLKQWANDLEVGVDHIAFGWRTFFSCSSISPRNPKTELIAINPIIFNTTNFSQSLSDSIGRIYSLSFVASYNTLGQLPQLSKLYQTTITHASGNLHNEIPKPEGVSGGIKTRSEEDGIKAGPRKQRLDKSKTMKSFKDIFEGFAKELVEQKKPNKRQLQEWLYNVRTGYSKKIDVPAPKKMDLPLDYEIKLDLKYEGYQIDNRNLPFEQPEQSQKQTGIRTFPIRMSESIQGAIDKIMMLSKQVGNDFNQDIPEIYRHTTCTIRECDGKYHTYIKIYKVKAARNTVNGPNSGPGENIVSTPLEFTYQDGKKTDIDITHINYRSMTDRTQKNIEKHADVGDISVVYGNREQTEYEREPDREFFKSGFSGVRGFHNEGELHGLQSGECANHIMNYTPYQTTSYGVQIRGNPWILNDINRNPISVKNDSVGKAKIYSKVESFPMHAKVIIFIDPANKKGLLKSKVDDVFYFNGYMHIARITNHFQEGNFFQTLDMLRTDDI